MTDQRLNSQDICMSDSMPFQQHYEAKTTWPLADVLHDQFFMNVRTSLRAGDSITICRYDRKDPAHRNVKLLEIATVRVLECEDAGKTVPIAMVGQISVLSEGPSKPALRVEKGERGKFKVMAGEDVIEEFGSRSEAETALTKLAA